jgi:hypothetical protein
MIIKMERGWIFVLFILGIGFFSVASADVVSINSGGDGGLILNPQNILEEPPELFLNSS